MKIFPPLSEMLGLTALRQGQVTGRGGILVGTTLAVSAAVVILALFALPDSRTGGRPQNDAAPLASIQSGTPDQTACNTLVLDRTTRFGATLTPCNGPSKAQSGRTIASKHPLERSAVLRFASDLTASDRAIRPPTTPFRSTVADHVARPATQVQRQPAPTGTVARSTANRPN